MRRQPGQLLLLGRSVEESLGFDCFQCTREAPNPATYRTADLIWAFPRSLGVTCQLALPAPTRASTFYTAKLKVEDILADARHAH